MTSDPKVRFVYSSRPRAAWHLRDWCGTQDGIAPANRVAAIEPPDNRALCFRCQAALGRVVAIAKAA